MHAEDGRDGAHVHQRIARLARDLHNNPVGDDAVVKEVVENAAVNVPGALYAGITVVTGRNRVTTPAASHDHATRLDEIQQRHRQGPCLAAAWEHHTVRADDLTTETRWPAYCRDALNDTPVRSVLSFQLFTAGHTMGALNVYAETPHAFTPDAEEIGLIFASHAALAWANVRRDAQFRSALASRDVIGQAKGIVMERFHVDAVYAFELLKRLSQESNTPLAEIARRLTETEDTETHGDANAGIRQVAVDGERDASRVARPEGDGQRR